MKENNNEETIKKTAESLKQELLLTEITTGVDWADWVNFQELSLCYIVYKDQREKPCTQRKPKQLYF